MMKVRKILSFVIVLSIILSTFSFSMMNNASALGNQTCTQKASGNYGMSIINMSFSNASKVEGNKVTYFVDSSSVSDLKDLGNIYSATFEMNGCILSSSIGTSNSSYSVSSPFVYNSQIFSSENKYLSDTANGTLIGPAPKEGETVTFSVTASMSVDFKYSGFPLNSSCSVKFDLVFYGVDMSSIEADCKTYQMMKESCWTASSWSAYKSVCEEAVTMKNNNCSVQSEIDALHQRVVTARDALVHNGNIIECEYCRSEKNGVSTDPLEFTNVVYGTNPTRQCMDLFLPNNVKGDISLILYLHGGGWIYGDKSEYTGRAKSECIKYGIAGLTISYRYTSQNVNAFDIVDDIAAALQKAKDIAKEHGLNITQMMTYGGSAGGHLSLFYSYYKRTTSPIKPVAAFSKCGPTNLSNPEYLDSNLGESTIRFELGSMCGTYFTRDTMILCRDKLLAVSPIYYVDKNTVPTVICHGMKDITVPFSDAVMLDKVLSDYGVEHYSVAYPNTNHAIDIGTDPDCVREADRLYDMFVNKYLLNVKPEPIHDTEVKTVEKTCTSDGYSIEFCKTCGAYQVSKVQRAGHDAITDPGYPASCTKEGLSDGTHCSICKQILSPQQTIDRLPHTPGDWEIAFPATFSEAGLEVQKCSVCEEVIDSRPIPKLQQPTFELKDGSEITIDETNNLICDVPQGTESFEDYFNLINCTLEYQQTKNGFGTGSKVIVKSLSGETLQSFTVVIPGDSTGDGYVDVFDVSVATEYINNFDEPADIAYLKALDVFADGFLDATDLAYIIMVSNYE